jgi:hypothetical protein
MDLLGIIWEVCLEPIVHWVAKKWVRFIVRKQRIWEPGTPFPSYFGQIRQAALCTPYAPWRILRAMSPLQGIGAVGDQMVPGQYRR